MTDVYYKAMKNDTEEYKEYFLKSINKTEQQKFLEKLLKEKEKKELYNIADLACGAGTLSFHLNNIYKDAKFTLVDYNEETIKLAKSLCKKDNFNFFVGDITNLPYKDNEFDSVFCWMTLSWVDISIVANILNEIIRILKKGQRAYLSSLFNINADVDILSKVYDYTRASGREGLFLNYNTYCKQTIAKILDGKVSNFEIIKFSPDIDIKYEGKGLGTYTKQLADGERLQISAGILMNWGILVIEK